MVLGDADTIAADGAELYDMVRDNNPLNRFISLPGRDHVNALTSGAFRRGALAFAAEVEGGREVAAGYAGSWRVLGGISGDVIKRHIHLGASRSAPGCIRYALALRMGTYQKTFICG